MEKYIVSDDKALHFNDVQLLNNVSGFFILLGLAAISQFLACASELPMNVFGNFTWPAALVNAAVPAFLFVIGIRGLSRRMTYGDMKRCRLICGILAAVCVLAILISLTQVQIALPAERVLLVGLYLIGCIVFTAVTYKIESRMRRR